jgi:uncharacterized protein YkwD
MKNLTYFLWLMAICVSLTSCSKDSIEETDSANLTSPVASVNYSSIELQILDLVNTYRLEQGLSELGSVDEGSVQAASHNEHMISNDEVCHDFFGSRYEALVKGVQAKAVSENVAYGYSSAEAVVNAWIKSEGHKKNIEGDYTHFGISVKEGKDGKLYFTNIFVRK